MELRVDPPVLLYDGDCAFCSSTARWLTDHVPGPTRLAPWQHTDLGALGVDPHDADAAVVFVDTRLDQRHGPDGFAALLATSTARTWRLLGRLLGTRAGLALGWPAYRAIARNRHRLPGGTPQCSLPQAERS